MDNLTLISLDEILKRIYASRDNNPHKDPKIARNHSLEHDHFAKMAFSCNAVDAVEVVRCKDCKYWSQDESGARSKPDQQKLGVCMWVRYCSKENDFCSNGERRSDNGF